LFVGAGMTEKQKKLLPGKEDKERPSNDEETIQCH